MKWTTPLSTRVLSDYIISKLGLGLLKPVLAAGQLSLLGRSLLSSPGISVFGTHELLDVPSLRGQTPPGFPGGGYGGGGPKLDGVHYRISRACGISGKLRRKYSPDRPPTPIRRLREMEARRRAEASASADILIVGSDHMSDLDAASARPSRPATRGSRR